MAVKKSSVQEAPHPLRVLRAKKQVLVCIRDIDSITSVSSKAPSSRCTWRGRSKIPLEDILHDVVVATTARPSIVAKLAHSETFPCEPLVGFTEVET